MRHKTRLAGLAAVAAGVLALSPAGASANSEVAPTSLTFSNQTVGTTSPPQSATVTVSCSLQIIFCITPGNFQASGTVAGDFAQTNNCGLGVTSPGNCTFIVTFTPTATGVRNGTLTTGLDLTGSDPSVVSMTGSGVAAPIPPLPPPSTTPPTTGRTGRRAAALKKCKKKPKGPKRTKCIKKAKKLPL